VKVSEENKWKRRVFRSDSMNGQEDAVRKKGERD